MNECVKCGFEVSGEDAACPRCSWPFSEEAWLNTSLRIYRLTLDTSCINAKRKNEALNVLESWAEEGLIALQRSDAMLSELAGEERISKASSMSPHPGLFILDFSTLDGPDVLAGPDLSVELQEVLFPNIADLTENQEHDVEHLRLHIRTGADLFVTLNKNDFITRGRQDTLRGCGIWVLQPPDAVALLNRLYGWGTE